MQIRKIDPTATFDPYQEIGRANPPSALLSWAAMMLPELDQQGLYDQIFSVNGDVVFSKPPELESFVCPDDAEGDDRRRVLELCGEHRDA